jgi:hypothetical protein
MTGMWFVDLHHHCHSDQDVIIVTIIIIITIVIIISTIARTLVSTYIGVEEVRIDGTVVELKAGDELDNVHGAIAPLPSSTRRVRLMGIADAFLIRPNGIPNGLVIRHDMSISAHGAHLIGAAYKSGARIAAKDDKTKGSDGGPIKGDGIAGGGGG